MTTPAPVEIELRDLVPTTTIAVRLESTQDGLAHVFAAKVSRDGLLRRRLKDLVNELCDGTATPLVQALVEGHRFTPDNIERLRRLLDELEGRAEE